MRAGPSFRRIIAQELDNAKCVVVLWSHQSIDSDWVCEEADEALRRAVLVPALLDPVRPPLGFRQSQTANLVSWQGDRQHPEFQVLREGITHHVTPQESTRSNGDEPPSLVANTRNERISRGPVLICYRREDAPDAAGRLHDHLNYQYGAQRVLIDLDDVPLGVNFVDHVAEHVQGCSAVVVIIGRHWLTATGKRGNRRLEDDFDYVRLVVAAALRLNVPILPVFVQDAEMPAADELPEDIRPLARRNGIELSATRWQSGVERLIKELDRLMKPSGGS